jgi:hypothetical protein
MVSHDLGTVMKRQPDACRCLKVAAILAILITGSATGGDGLQSHSAEERFDRPVSVLWSETPFRDALDRLAAGQKVAVWLDRRVDPGRPVSLTINNTPVRDVLARAARDQGLGMCFFDSVAYLGPPEVVGRLRTLGQLRRQDVETLPRGVAKRFLRTETTRWDDLSSPRELLAALVQRNGLVIDGLDRVVHDLWPAADLPSLPLVDRLTLILAPLDLTFQLEDRSGRIRLVPVPNRVALTRRYPGGNNAAGLAEKWRRTIPESHIRVEGNQVVVEGRLEDHESLESERRQPRAQISLADRQDGDLDHLRIKYFVVKDLPLEGALRQLATRLNLELHLDADALRRSGMDVDRRISLTIRDATVDELFRAILQPAGLTFRRDGSTLEVHAARR